MNLAKSNLPLVLAFGLFCLVAISVGAQIANKGQQAVAREPVESQPVKEPRTIIICASPFNLSEAQLAYDNAKWLESLNCARIAKSTPKQLIERTSSLGVKVRIAPNSSSGGMTVWTDFLDYDEWTPAPKPAMEQWVCRSAGKCSWEQLPLSTLPTATAPIAAPEPKAVAPVGEPGTVKICKGNDDNCTSFATPGK